MKKTALIIGATGLVGVELLKLLVADPAYSEIKVFSRRAPAIASGKIVFHLVDFNDIESWRNQLKGEVLFSCLGTTIKKAGTQERQYQVDYTYQYEVAKAAAANGVKSYVLVSSYGADASSKGFYTRIKGELDDTVRQLGFSQCVIFRPSMLAGDRKEFRLGERIGLMIMPLFTWIPVLAKYRAIQALTVAQAMLKAVVLRESRVVVLEEIHQMAQKNTSS